MSPRRCESVAGRDPASSWSGLRSRVRRSLESIATRVTGSARHTAPDGTLLGSLIALAGRRTCAAPGERSGSSMSTTRRAVQVPR